MPAVAGPAAREKKKSPKKTAPSGNRTRVTSMATRYYTTKPPTALKKSFSAFEPLLASLAGHNSVSGSTQAGNTRKDTVKHVRHATYAETVLEWETCLFIGHCQ